MALSDKLNPDKVPNAKLGLHLAQVVLALTIFILEIIVFRAQDSKINGNNAWPFGLCFLSIPAWVYLALAPRYERTRRAANPNVMLVIDAIFAIFWLSAFASQAAYNTANSCGKACAVSKAIVGLGFFETLGWILSTLVSAYTLQWYRDNGDLPGYERIGTGQNIDPDKAAFSMAPHDEEAYAPVNMDDHHDDINDDAHSHRPYDSSSYSSRPLYEAETSYQPHHTSSPAPHENPFDNSYRTHHSVSPNPSPFADPYAAPSGGPKIYAPPAADDYDDGRPVQFPSANYDRTLH
ncbi:putative chaperone-binding protein [Rosellinia necatrix]|uniref:Putative chaperone-binding protein n=1 Tax=Rosellinia necatrix TaxID=77044 RepID=A0A1S7ULK4_ROSNE|nr:putative chaperone-binding protein [Rosellinia necatrix]